MKRASMAIAFALALAMAPQAFAHDFEQGDWVLARWQGAGFWFPGVVKSVRGDMITVSYDDGMSDTRPLREVKPYDWRVGTRVECQWQSGNDWYPGRITAADKDGESLAIQYDDGDRERTRTGKCRSR
ncbi:MAG: DUF4537 domain-containing protein [Xanthomonadales bacterium]|nr:DUF4537 domain-containing protein [Xanthomonadales bacterium]